MERAGWLLPPVAAQTLLHRLADTDLQAQLSYQDSLAALHRRVRYFYYPYLFEERPFTRDDFGRLPEYEPRSFGESLAWGALTGLVLAALLLLALGLRRAQRVGSPQPGAAAGISSASTLQPALT